MQLCVYWSISATFLSAWSCSSLSSSFLLFNITCFNFLSTFYSCFLKRLASVLNCPSIMARQVIRKLLVQRRFTLSIFWRTSQTSLRSRVLVTKFLSTPGTGARYYRCSVMEHLHHLMPWWLRNFVRIFSDI